MAVDPSNLDTYWRDLPDTSTPFEASTLNAWGARIKTAWLQALTAAAPTDPHVAALIADEASATRVQLDAAYGDAVSVEEYGATGDGVTDDTAACQAALTAGAGKVVRFRPGRTYSVDPLYAPNAAGTHIDGRGATIKRRPATVTNPDSVGVLNLHGAPGALMTGPSVVGLTIDGNRSQINVDTGSGGDPYDVEGLSLKYATGFRIIDVTVLEVTAEGIDVDDSTDGLITGITGVDCGGSAVHLSNGSARIRLTDSAALRCGTTLSRAGFDAYSGGTDHTLSGLVTVDCFRGTTLASPGSTATGCLDFGPTSGVGIRATAAATTVVGSRSTGSIEHTGTSGALVACSSSGSTVTATHPAVAVVACTPDPTTAVATLTYSAGWSAGGAVRVERHGQWVRASYRFDKSSPATEQETIATLPVGFRPAEASYGGDLVLNGSSVYVGGGIQIQTGGQIQARLGGASGATRVVGSAMWRVA